MTIKRLSSFDRLSRSSAFVARSPSGMRPGVAIIVRESAAIVGAPPLSQVQAQFKKP
ncbi:hypothetical protein BRPE64_ACDS28450 [Caballeronia insecticola]|uniref:Uncharacterized protein n=1 Tax=Caballeronia insecticola TaxID=758793 RepID=R4WJL8_9BURK|nr:hypothetical protein BRPE64_ACDS28450 [Caballeronia insecticola]